MIDVYCNKLSSGSVETSKCFEFNQIPLAQSSVMLRAMLTC